MLNKSPFTESWGSEPTRDSAFFRVTGSLWARTKKRLEQLHYPRWKLLGRENNGANGANKPQVIRFKTLPDQSQQKNALDGTLKRPHVRGKFLFVGNEKFWVRGVTYGTFRPDESGAHYPAPDVVERDFIAIRSAGLNAIRVYTVPPRWLLDLAASQDLRVMVGLWWEQHTAFLEDRTAAHSIVARIRKDVAKCAAHPAILCYAIGNEITGSIVRWYGSGRVERFLAELCTVVRQQDPGALVTYVNYPTTEYLELSCVDFVAFNVYLESRERLAAYLARLQNIAGDRPLLLAELGLDSRRNGVEQQADTLKWQLKTIFEDGCAGTFVFAWTDEWNCAGNEIEDWDFGLTTRDRRAKPALSSVTKAFKQIPFADDYRWPRISVVVCSCNGSETISETLTALDQLNYPDYEVIVIDDGSKDGTASIAREHGVHLIQTENRGLSNARNQGMEAATGDIIAYIDDDAYPDPDWLKFLAASFLRADHAGIGGPNIAPAGDGLIADALAYAPGGPVHVLLSDQVAEHIPGCNMAFRLDRLRAIGGFDPRFKVAGDDVDICWRLQERGWSLGYSPAALVWHHRRRSLRAYWKQQGGYAKAESLLAEKWPEKYNEAGHLKWAGRLYGRGVVNFFLSRRRIYHGTWNSALFQSIYEPSSGIFSALLLMPEWYFLLGLLGILSALGLLWPPLLSTAPIFVLALATSLIQAGFAAAKQPLDAQPRRRRSALRILIAWAHLIQPLARLVGRMHYRIGPWRGAGLLTRPARLRHKHALWCEKWQTLEARLAEIEAALLREHVVITKGGDFDRWDMEIRGGVWGSIRALAMIEEHGAGKQQFRVRAWPQIARPVIGLLVLLGLLAALAALDQAWLVALPLAVGVFCIALVTQADCAKAMRSWCAAIGRYADQYAVLKHDSAEKKQNRGIIDELSPEQLKVPSIGLRF